MIITENLECIVCFNRFSRSDRIPRVLHCNHTFCCTCLKTLSKLDGPICTVSCPLCRWITCTRASLTLPGSLYVNTEIWDLIAEGQQENESVEDLKSIQSALRDSRQPSFMSTLHKIFRRVLRKRHVMDSC